MNCTKYRPTIILIIINIAVYIYTSIIGGNALNTNINVMAYYGQWNYAVFHGYYYQLLTSMFVHASIAHIGGNMLFLFVFGLRGKKCFRCPNTSAYILGQGWRATCFL